MPSTSVHFPKGVLEEIDRRAAEEGLSRNRVIVEACRKALEEGRVNWPPGFFSDDHLTKAARKELRESEEVFARTISDRRKSRKVAPF